MEEREAGDAMGLNSDSAPLCPVVSPPDSPSDRGERVQYADALEEEEEDICEHDLRFMDCSKCLPPLVGPTGSVLALVCLFVAARNPFNPPPLALTSLILTLQLCVRVSYLSLCANEKQNVILTPRIRVRQADPAAVHGACGGILSRRKHGTLGRLH